MPANQSNALEDSPMEDSAGESAESDTPGAKKQADPAKRLTRIVLAAVAVLFGCHMAALPPCPPRSRRPTLPAR